MLAGAVTNDGAIANAVSRGFERALCVVGGGDCYATELQACTLSAAETSGRVGIKLTLVRLGASLSLLRQEMSDGTVDVTFIDGGDAAPTAALGAKVGIRMGASGVSTGAITSAELIARLGRRRVWHVADDAAADRLIHDLKRDLAVRAVSVGGAATGALARLVGVHVPALPPVDEAGFTAGVSGAVAADLPGGARVAAGLDASFGGSRDRATKRTVVVLGLEGDASTVLGAAVGSAGLSAAGAASATVTFDRSGAPLDLAVSVAGSPRPSLAGGLELPAEHKGKGGGADRVERTTHLDLTVPDNRAGYDALVHVLTSPLGPGAGSALTGLVHRLRIAGRQDVNRYVTRTLGYGAEGEVALGGRVGVGVEVDSTTQVLRDAWTRPAGGVWERRTDCVDSGTRV